VGVERTSRSPIAVTARWWVLALVWLAIGGCCPEPSRELPEADFSDPNLPGGDLVVAEIDGKPITASHLKHKIRVMLPAFAQTGPEMALQARSVLDRVVTEQCMVRLAELEGYDKDPEYVRMINLYRDGLLANRALSLQTRRANVNPSQDALREQYDENRERFYVKPRAEYFHMLFASEADARQAYRRLQAGEAFEDLATELSIDEISAKRGGKMPAMDTYHNAGHLGKVPQLGEQVLAMRPGEVSEPFETSKGWHIVRVDRYREGHYKAFEEVREDIARKLRMAQGGRKQGEMLDSLRQAYSVKIHHEALDEFYFYQMDDAGLFEVAQREMDKPRQLRMYEWILDHYPGSRFNAESLFMVGYLRAEETADTSGALRALGEFLEKYPEHEMASSAQSIYAAIKAAAGQPGESEAAPR
jgi:peptidyl-prolyl cis-trans isomerase C